MTSKPFISPCKFVASFTAVKLPKNSICIVDARLKKIIPKGFLRNRSIYWVQAGERLKALKGLSGHYSKILKIAQKHQRSGLTLVAIGGGSVGDFAGFVASTLFRGVALVHIPSTWLAAVDSAHGGKTALNVEGVKNQIGTYYFAQQVLLVETLLKGQPRARSQEAYFEFLKMALLSSRPWGKAFLRNASSESKFLWKSLKFAIQEKNSIVKKDPFEKKGIRHFLNFGHTLGHAVESGYKLPHGVAVGYGLDFALWWSIHRGYLAPKSGGIMREVLGMNLSKKVMSVSHLMSLLVKDKKKTSLGSLNFVFLKAHGSPLLKEVRVSEMRAALHRYFR
ncbi:3-dehydroquinate synthase [bacterium]|nr:3-dehydroquinate synthase [bacterium]